MSETCAGCESFIPPVTHVRDHGAIGDGTTDDSAAIQAAVDSTPEKWGDCSYTGLPTKRNDWCKKYRQKLGPTL